MYSARFIEDEIYKGSFDFSYKIEKIKKHQLEIMKKIIPGFELKKKILSPFRQDKNPGCYFNEYNGKIYFHDWATDEHLDIFSFVSKMYSINFSDTVHFLFDLINNDITLEQNIVKSIKKYNSEKERIIVNYKSFTDIDKEYWNSYNISLDELNNDNQNFTIGSVEKFKLINKNIMFIPQTLCFCYNFKNDEKKIYLPNTKNKWISTVSKNNIGITKKNHNEIIITKSVKDFKVLQKTNNDVMLFQSETSFPDENVLDNYLKNYQKVKIFFDNDETGIKNSNKLYNTLIKKYDVQNIIIKEFEKDPADLVKKYGFSKLLIYVQ